jgi:hypothetical protein
MACSSTRTPLDRLVDGRTRRDGAPGHPADVEACSLGSPNLRRPAHGTAPPAEADGGARSRRSAVVRSMARGVSDAVAVLDACPAAALRWRSPRPACGAVDLTLRMAGLSNIGVSVAGESAAQEARLDVPCRRQQDGADPASCIAIGHATGCSRRSPPECPLRWLAALTGSPRPSGHGGVLTRDVGPRSVLRVMRP